MSLEIKSEAKNKSLVGYYCRYTEINPRKYCLGIVFWHYGDKVDTLCSWSHFDSNWPLQIQFYFHMIG